MLSLLLHNNVIFLSVKAAHPSSNLVSSPNVVLSSSSLSGVLSANNIILLSLSRRYFPLNPYSHRLFIDPFLPRSVPLFRHLFSFAHEADVARNSLLQGYLINNEASTLPLVGIIALE